MTKARQNQLHAISTKVVPMQARPTVGQVKRFKIILEKGFVSFTSAHSTFISLSS